MTRAGVSAIGSRRSTAASRRPRGSAPPASRAASRAGGLDLALIVGRRAGVGRGGVHDQPGAGGAGPRLAAISWPRRGGHARGDRRQQRLRQRLHRRRRHDATPKRWPTLTAAALGVRSVERAGRVDRRHRRQARHGQGRRAGSPGGGRALAATAARDAARAHHDDRSVSQGSGGRGRRRATGTLPRRRHRQGLRHDRADHGDDARRS